jgi:hypothetical protein
MDKARSVAVPFVPTTSTGVRLSFDSSIILESLFSRAVLKSALLLLMCRRGIR